MSASTTPVPIGAVDQMQGTAAGHAGAISADPRTKLLLLLVVNALVLGNGPFSVTLAGFVVVAALLATAGIGARRWLSYAIPVAGLAIAFLLLPRLGSNAVLALVVAMAFWFVRFAVAIGLAWYLVATTGPAEFSAGLSRLRVPQSIVIPFAVMLRFIPAAMQELRAIVDGMRLRGVLPHGAAIMLHPMRTAEYIFVPLLASTTRISDDLAASALIRGLGITSRPTSVVRLGFGPADAVLLLVTAAVLAVRLSGWEVAL